MRHIHDAPIFRIQDVTVFKQFCERYRIRHDMPAHELIVSVASAFSTIPYENLTKIIKADGVVGPSSAMRYPDEVLSDHLHWGTGGTCFSLTAAIIAVFDAFGIEAQPLLADRHYGPDTHCGLVVIPKGESGTSELLLLDPGYLLFTPVPLPTAVTMVIPQGYTTIELCPYRDGQLIEFSTIVKGNRKVRLVYKRAIVDPEEFTRAWIASFAWEMMTYPVATRSIAGQHIYLQGSSVAIRTPEKTHRMKLDQAKSIVMMKNDFGISTEITLKAWKIIDGNT